MSHNTLINLCVFKKFLVAATFVFENGHLHLLKRAGADENIKNNDGISPFELTREFVD